MKMKMITSIACIALLLCGAAPGAEPFVVTPQERNDSTASEMLKSLKEPPRKLFDEREKNVPNIHIEKEQAAEAPPVDVSFVFRTFMLQGATVLQKEEVEAVIRPFIGQTLTISQLQKLSDLITKLYAQKGYVTSFCFIPSQKIEDGKVIFQCVETRIGRVVIKDAEEYNEKLFIKFIKPLRDKPLRIDELNERLKALSLIPAFIANVEVKRTDKIDVVDIHIELKQKSASSATVYLDNMGNRQAGRERFGVSYDIVNPTWYGDFLNLHAWTSLDTKLSHYISATYKRVVNDEGGILSLTGSYNDYEVEEKKSPGDLRFNGDSLTFLAHYRHPLLLSDRYVVTGTLFYEFKDVAARTSILWTDPVFDKEDKTHVVGAGIDTELVDRLGGINFLSLSVRKGLEGFFNGTRKRDTHWANTFPIKGTIREGIAPDFILLSASLNRRQIVKAGGYSFESLISLYGQYTPDRVPSAYTFADGDYGYHAEVEFRFPILGDALKLDIAGIYEKYHNSSKSRDLIGTSSKDTTTLVTGIVGYLKRYKLDYYLSYVKGLSGRDATWEGYRNYGITFYVGRKF